MTKEQFLHELDTSLRGLSKEEKQDILHDFEEHFEIGKLDGKSEDEIARSLGTPNQIAKELLAAYYLEKAESTSSTGNVLRAVWAVIGLGFFNLVIVLGPFIALAAIIVSGWITGGAFTISPFLFVINLIFYPGSFEYFDLFFSIALAGVGLLMIIGMLFITRFVTKGFMRYLNFNVRIVKGGMK